ncbi:MAG TPA: STAS domain-containing protein [Gaiellales bacterium]|jgi:anti-anti-sigma factor|nr:STAS domain-containing protein [Gaiellales bacterium]
MSTPQIVITQTGSAPAIVSLSGEHDRATSHQLDATLSRAIDAGDGVVVDLTEASFIDSAILCVLIRAHDAADALGKEGLAVVAPPSSAAARLFDLVAADKALAIFPSREGALATYAAIPGV